jgi:hypothetical protein
LPTYVKLPISVLVCLSWFMFLFYFLLSWHAFIIPGEH